MAAANNLIRETVVPTIHSWGIPIATAFVRGLGGLALFYVAIAALLTIPVVERNAIYMHNIKTTAKNELNYPENFGFKKGRVVPFHLVTRDGLVLHAWHVLPLSLYSKHKEALLRGTSPVPDIRETLNFRLLRDDPEALLVIYTHGSSGTLASSWRVDCYRALSSVAPEKIHVLTFDYRGFGLSEGQPAEEGLTTDAESVYKWATEVAGIPTRRIVVLGHSMGAGVAIALVQRLLDNDIQQARLVMVSGFVDMATIAKTYRVIGVPVFMPLQTFPGLVELLTSKLRSTWKNGERLKNLVKMSHRMHFEILHAQDDAITSWKNALGLWHYAVTGIGTQVVTEHEESEPGEPCTTIRRIVIDRGAIQMTCPKAGNHDKILSRPALVAAVKRTFHATGLND